MSYINTRVSAEVTTILVISHFVMRFQCSVWFVGKTRRHTSFASFKSKCNDHIHTVRRTFIEILTVQLIAAYLVINIHVIETY